jgi:predicted acylesterase/phospholipase RssA
VRTLHRSTRFASAVLVFVLGACGGASGPAVVTSKAEIPQPTCLALSVGGAAGVAHLGAIESLRAHDVEISCVVGNSMGSLVGALYASNPDKNTTEDFRSLIGEYVTTTKEEGEGRMMGAGLVGLAVFGPLGAIFGAMAGAGSVDKLNHDRLVTVLNRHLAGATIETLPVPYATSYMQARNQKADFINVRTGNLAQAVGDSVANPFIFRDIDVHNGGRIDPGGDRPSAVPIEQTCATFRDRRVLAVNVTPDPSFVSTRMRCPMFEIRVAVPPSTAEAVLTDPSAFTQMVAAGREAADAWFETAEGRRFLATARRTPTRIESGTNSESAADANTQAEAIPSGPQWYSVQVVSAELGSHKPSGADWDGSDYGPADPRVILEVRGAGNGTLATPIAQDTLTPTWDVVRQMQIARGDTLEITVLDADALSDDQILSASVPFVGPKTYVIREPSQSLDELVIDIRKASP